jgi:hypothetical protein
MTIPLSHDTLILLEQFHQSFPKFYAQFVSTEVQLQNLKFAYQIYQQRCAVLFTRLESDKTVLYFGHRNSPFLMTDIFGVLAAYGLTIHNLNVYGQIKAPMLVFLRITLTRGDAPLTDKLAENVKKALRETLMGKFDVETMLANEFNLDSPLKKVDTSFYIDRVVQLPSLLVEANSEPAFFYKVMRSLSQEDLLVISANLLVWRGRTRLILYLLGANQNLIPEHLGHKIALSIQERLGGTTVAS